MSENCRGDFLDSHCSCQCGTVNSYSNKHQLQVDTHNGLTKVFLMKISINSLYSTEDKKIIVTPNVTIKSRFHTIAEVSVDKFVS